MEIVQLLLAAAHAGDEELVALRGYSLRRKLGEGGMGAIFLIRHDATGDQLALKLMLPRVAVQPGTRRGFYAKRRILGPCRIVISYS